jgi:probable HAF family extracellular repeat protein
MHIAGRLLNNSGQVVGYSQITGNTAIHPFLYSGGVMKDLGTLGGSASYAFGINNSGQVVGGSRITGNTAYHAFLYSSGVMTDLNNLISSSSGWTLNSANAINTYGDIVGSGTNAAGQTEAFLLTPTVAPEPTTLALLAVGGLGLLIRRGRNQISG